MLILSRKVDQAIVIGDEIKITLLGVSGSQAKLGIDAPRDVSVHREEVYERIESQDNAETSGDNPVEND